MVAACGVMADGRPYADLPMTFEQVAVKEDGRHLTWIGRNPAMPGASFAFVLRSPTSRTAKALR